MKIFLIADFFTDEIVGGGELNNEELVKLLNDSGHPTKKIKSRNLTQTFLKENQDGFFIVSNFLHLDEGVKTLLSSLNYLIYEHDHKYIRTRNPALYKDYLAPPSEIVNYDFYKKAKAVLCQSQFHTEIVKKNLKLNNIHNLGGNLWSEDTLKKIEIHSKKQKTNKHSIMNSSIEHKNTRDAVVYCEYNRLPYELIPPSTYSEFLDKLSNNSKLIFLPKTPETLSRIVVEARMMNMGVVTNSRVGASSEPWFEKKGKDLIDIMRAKKEEILQKVLEIASNE